MKLCLVFLFLSTRSVQGFLNFLPSGEDAVTSFLSAINSDVETTDDRNEFMRHAVHGELCNRDCRVGDSRVCHFKFMIKYYQVMSGACGSCLLGNVTACLTRKCVTADGIQRGILSINFQLPGPSLQVCKGDMLVVDVQNQAEGMSTSIHFHGMRQIDTPFMDGVPYLTQCPIPYGSTFRYAFHARDDGTHFYHSHSGHQKIDGLFGALIVRKPIEAVATKNFYDFDLPEHVILASDWMHQMAAGHSPGMIRRSSLSESMLINGRGRYFNATKNHLTFAPWAVFHVQAGMKYRFRIINSAFNVCPFQFQIEDHEFKIVATELSDIEPLSVDTLRFLSGERYDIVIDASHPPKDYWIRIRELSPCYKNIEGFAILRYHNKTIDRGESVVFNDREIPSFDVEYPTTKVFNSLKPKIEDISVTEVKSYDSDESLLQTNPDQIFHLVFDSPSVQNHIMYAGRNLQNFVFVTADFTKQVSFVGVINNISFEFPTFPLLTEPHRIDESMFCDVHHMKRNSCIKNSNVTVCKCIHRLKVKLNASVEIIAYNTLDNIPHPLHIHGHKFHIVDTGTLNETMIGNFEDYVNLNITAEHAKNPPFKDTCIVPYPGYVKFRFRATNPGFWLFHCHYDWHMPIGMALVVQVGEIHEMKSPPADFPTCHDFLPSEL